MIYYLLFIFILTVFICEYISIKNVKVNSYKAFIYFIFLISFNVALNSKQAFIEVSLFKSITLILDSRLLSIIFFYLYFIIKIHNDKLFLGSWKKILISLLILISTGVSNLEQLVLFSPCLLYFLEGDHSLRKPMKLMIFNSWISFLIIKNINILELNTLVYFINAITFCYYILSLYEERKKEFYIIAFPALLIHIKTINILNDVNELMLFFLILIGLYSLLIKYLDNKKEQLIVLMSPLFLYFGNLIFGEIMNIDTFVIYLFILSILCSCIRSTHKKFKSYYGMLLLLLFTLNLYMPSYLFILGLKSNGFIKTSYFSIIAVNFLVGIYSKNYLIDIIKDIKEELFVKAIVESKVLEPVINLLSGLLVIMILYTLNPTSIKLNTSSDESIVILMLIFMSYASGIMMKYIFDGSSTLTYYIDKTYYLVKTIFYKPSNYPTEKINIIQKNKNTIKLSSFLVIIENFDKEMEKEIILILSLLMIGILLMVIN